MFRLVFGLVLAFLVNIGFAKASIADYAKYFEVDMSEELPSLKQLKDEFIKEERLYNSKYNSIWDIGEIFDKAFYIKMSSYAGQEKRLKTEDEDQILQMLSLMPKEHYQYVGPMLHTIPGMSDKVLNLPGIKETKNKFPTTIAEQAKNIEGIEFLSPFLYYMLMPEVWGEKQANIEFPRFQRNTAKVKFKPNYFSSIDKAIKNNNVIPDENGKKIVRGDFRTISPTENSLLTSKDIQAFVSTLDDINEFYKSGDNQLLLAHSMFFISEYEKKQGNALPVNGLKDMVNPCQRLALRLKVAGKDKEFTKIIAPQGFTLEEWAYTCDKTVKAFRAASMSRQVLLNIKAYKAGIYDEYIETLPEDLQIAQYSAMRALIEMYNAPVSDVLEVLKNKKNIADTFLKYENRIAGAPVDRLQ